MKALEKAAKDRGETAQVTPPPGTAAPASAPAPRTAATAAAASASSKMELALEPLSADTPEPERAPAGAGATKPATAAPKPNDQARAAAVLQASAAAAPAAVTGKRVKPVLIVGIAAGIAVIGFGVYVYLQITNPGLFITHAPPAPKPPVAQTPPPPPQQPQPITTEALVAPATPGAPSSNGTPATPAPAPGPGPAASTPVAEALATPRPATPSRTDAPRDGIRVSAGTPEPQLDPRLSDGYAALQAGKLDSARQIYADALRSDPKNIQALLGSAAVAMQQNSADEASRLYFRVLDLEPRNPYAQAGIVALMGRADPAAAEAKLKQLIAREPLASLHFTLGNLYGDQSRWAEAQQAYFQAHHLEPGNPDYAYNLAVGLEHVGQAKLATGYYRRAVELAQARGRAGFNLNQAQDRIRQLAAQPE